MKKRFLSLLLCAVMVYSFIPQGMAVASASADDGLCEHHTEHTEDCGYVEAAEGTPCTYDCPICSELELDSGDADYADVEAQILNNDTAAVIQDSDGTYAQYATLQKAVQAVTSTEEATIQIVKDMTITELIDIKNKKIRLEADEAHRITFSIPGDAANQNCFRVTGYSSPASLAIGENITASTTNNSLRSIVNVGGQQGSFSLEGGTLSSGSANLAKAIVCVDNGGTMSMSGGTIQGNTGHNSRGVFLQDTNGQEMSFTMTGGKITDCFLTDKTAYGGSGAGVLIIGKADFTMTGGAITKCSATGYGGGVAIFDQGTFTMNDGTIESCSSGSGGYVYTAQGAKYILNGGVAQIGTQKYLSLKEAINAIERGQNDTTTIKIIKDTIVTEPIDIENKKIKLEAVKAHTITFNIPDGATNRNCFRVTGQSKPSSLAIGENITVTTTNNSLRSIVNVGGQQGSFSLEGGTLSSGSANLAKAIVCVDNGGTMSMSGGTIQGNTGHNSRGVFLQDTNGQEMTFTMTGGKITDCFLTDKTTYGGSGAGVLIIGKADFTMTGGAITKCSATGYGGGVAIFDQAAFTMNDGTIESCSSGSGGYVYTAQGASFIINGGTVGSVEKDGVAQIGNQKYLSLKAAIDAVAKGQNDATTIRIVKNMTITEPIDIGNRKIKLEADEAHTITFDIPDDAANRNCFRVTGHSSPASLTIGENLTVTTISDSLRSIVNVGGQQGSFFLEGGTLSSGNADLAKAIVCVDNGGTASMSSGEVRGNKGHNSCGFLLQDTSKDGWAMAFTMSGGTITDCSSSDKGAGVLVMGNAKFIMDGGKITQCSATWHGGGVAILERATFMMRGGEISACTAAQGGGGGVFAKDDVAFTLSGGKISSCEATNNGSVGGGIYLRGKNITFTMSGGMVCDNTAEYTGGGICTESDVAITAGIIQNNRTTCATGFGGGIYVDKTATLKLTNVVITDNTAAALGGGIWSCRTGDIKIYITNGGAVFDNSAKGNGNMKTPEQAGDDIVSTVTFPAAGFLFISHHMLGGGANRYYIDGGVTGFRTTGLDHHHGEGWGLGAPDGKIARYDAGTSNLVTETYITKAIALKNVVSEAAKTGANKDAKLIISGNSASRGGGIGTNGNLIIGTPDPDSETGNLTVKKEVAGKDQETGKEFSIQVTLKRDDSTAADITGEYGEIIFINGIATVTLKTGQSITATGLPTGISYTVEETAESQDGYTVTYTNQTGTIGKDGTVIATVMNTKDTPPKPTPETGSLTVSKTVSGDGASSTEEFTFTVTLDNAGIAGVYGGMTFENSVATFTLKDGESKTASNLPVGVGYTVAESDNEGYTVTVNGETSTKATGTITANTTATAAFNNYKAEGGTTDPDPKYGGVKIIKTVRGEKAPAESVEYEFKVWVQNSGGTAVSESVSYTIAKEDGTTETGSATIGTNGYTFHLKNGESITFSGITSGSLVEIQEITTGDFTTTTSGLTDGICMIFSNNTREVGFVNTYGGVTPTPDPIPTPTPPDPEPTPKPDDSVDDVSQTGDNSNISLWVALACFSLFSMAVGLFGGKRHYKRRR